MKNLGQRINEAIEKIDDIECKLSIKEFYNMITKFTDSTDAIIFESFQKHFGENLCSPEVNEELDRYKKFNTLNTLDLSDIRESIANLDLSDMPQLSYQLNGIISGGNTFSTAKRLYEFVSSLKQDSRFLPIYEFLNYTFKRYSTELSILEALSGHNNIADDYAIEKLEDSLYEFLTENEIGNTDSMIKQLEPYQHSNKIVNVQKILKSLVKEDKFKGNDNFIVEDLISFTKFSVDNKKMFFGDTKNIYEFHFEDYTIRPVDKAQYESFNDILDLNNFISTNRNSITRESINLQFNQDSIEIKIDDKEVFYNGKLVEENFLEFFERLSKLNHIRNKTRIIKVYENLEKLMLVDFAKVIKSKDLVSEAVVFNFGNKFYADFINRYTNENKFLIDADAMQIKNELVEFMGFDVEDNLNEFMQDKLMEVGVFKNKIKEIEGSIAECQSMIEQIENSKNNNEIEEFNIDAVETLKRDIVETMENLRDQIGELKMKIYETEKRSASDFEPKTTKISEGETWLGWLKEDETVKIPTDLQPNTKVFLKDRNILATVTAINTAVNTIAILTDDGQTLGYKVKDFNKIVIPVNDDIIKGLQSLSDEAEKVKNIEKIGESAQSINPFKGYGVEGKFASQNDLKKIENNLILDNYQKFKDDVSYLNSIKSKFEGAENVLSELEQFLKQYNKINDKPIQDIIAQIKTYKEQIEKEISNI